MRTKSSQKRSRPVRTGPISDEETANRRNRVLQIAGDEFLAHGFRGASIEVIAKRSRVSKVTIYREYRNKESLFREFFNTSISGYRSNLEQALRNDRPLGDVVRDIIRFMVVTNAEDKRNFGILRLAIAERNRFPNVARMVLDLAYEIARPLGAYLKTMSRNSGMTSDDAERRAFHLMNMAVGGFGVLLDDPRTFYGNHDVWVESVARAFLDGLSQKK
jgi:AcrR family transcriptional regulator